MAQKAIVLITGANTGLGFEMVKALCDSETSYEILLAGRSLGKAEQAALAVKKEFPSTISTVVPVRVDIEDDVSIQDLFNEMNSKYDRLDALINNAGGQFDQQYHSHTLNMRSMWNKSWNVNVTGTQIMTHTFIPLLLKSPKPRLLFLTSGTSTLKGSENLNLPINRVPEERGWPKDTSSARNSIPAYRSAKCGMNMLMREFHRTLLPDSILVHALSPGFLATNLGGNAEMLKAAGAGDPALAGTFVRDVLAWKRDADVGKVITRDGVQEW